MHNTCPFFDEGKITFFEPFFFLLRLLHYNKIPRGQTQERCSVSLEKSKDRALHKFQTTATRRQQITMVYKCHKWTCEVFWGCINDARYVGFSSSAPPPKKKIVRCIPSSSYWVLDKYRSARKIVLFIFLKPSGEKFPFFKSKIRIAIAFESSFFCVKCFPSFQPVK